MKKIILELLNKYFELIENFWTEKLLQKFGNKLTENQLSTFVNSSLKTLMEVIEKTSYETADQYLIETYNLFLEANLNLLEISEVFGTGRSAIINFIEKEKLDNYDPIIILAFIDNVIEQVYARYGVLHQEASMKEIENDRDRLASKLEINQTYLDNILHSSDSAIIVIDNNEKIIGWNNSAENIFGYKEEEVIGKSSSLLLPKEEKYHVQLKTIQKEVEENGFTKVTDTERITKKGNIVTVDLSVARMPSKNGSYNGRTVIIKDFTEVKKLQQQVDQSEKLVVIGQLAAGVAHEIGNPLTSISSLVQLLQRKTNEDFTREYLANIKENIDRISKIVRELVDFSRPPSHEKMSIQINEIVRTAIGIVKYDKRVKKVDFDSDLDFGIPKTDIVPDQLLQVFVNILINALDAMEGNGTIKVKTMSDDESIHISISDTGHGMDSDTIDKIFDPFFTTKAVGKGTGLGLSVSYGIIKKFGGDIKVESKLNEGSTFTIKLPIKAKEMNSNEDL